jgi:hypothetical protein
MTRKSKTPSPFPIWSVVDIWPNSTVFILGGGPSLNDVDFGLIKDQKIIGINNAYQLGDWVDVCYFGDTRWYSWHSEKLSDFGGLIVHSSNVNSRHVKRLLRGKSMGIDTRKKYVAWNYNSGGSAINLAYHLGARRIVLLGYDMRRVDDQANWHQGHPNAKKNPYERFLRCFPEIKKDADELGVEILNATPDSELKVFPIVKLKDII